MNSIGLSPLSIEDFSDIVFKGKTVTLSESVFNRIDTNFRFLQKFSSNKLIYGINTGFGPMAQYKISENNLLQLQYNLIRSHSSGSGSLLSPVLVRALMIARLNSLIKAYSGIHTDLIRLLVDLINKNITPCIFEHGGVGASGDLVQLAHLALVMIGEGEVVFEDFNYPTLDIFDRLGIKPLHIHIREGIAILNGTSAMTGVGAINIIQSQKLLEWSVMLSAMTNEVVEAYDDHFSRELNILKHHEGQNQVAAMLRGILNDSKMIRKRPEHLYYSDNIEQKIFEEKVQEYYSLRCVTQILGPIYDTIVQAENVVVNELNSVNDNPVIDHENQNIFHGGNFHGDYVSLEMDKLKIAIAKLSMLSERQLNYLMNDKLNKKFPPFVNLGVLGLNFGMQGVQFTATSTVAENQTLSFPMYVHSISNNNDNQDIVSMGFNASMMTRRVIDNSFTVLSIQLMGILQAIDFLSCQGKLAPITLALYKELREIFPKFVEDQPKYKDIKKIKNFLETSSPVISFKNKFK